LATTRTQQPHRLRASPFIDFDGTIVSGKGASTDVIEASARAYLSALNRMVHTAQRTKVVGP